MATLSLPPPARRTTLTSSSRALQVQRFGTPPHAEVRDLPVYEDDDRVMVEVLAASVEPLDRQVIAGGLPGATAPLVPGISAIVRRSPTGPRMALHAAGGGLGIVADGTFRSMLAVTPSLLTEVPTVADAVPTVDLAAMLVPATTAALALQHLAELQPGEHVLVLGASGAVGASAVWLARRAGAEVTAVARDPDRLTVPEGVACRALDEVIEAGLERPADVVIDPVGGTVTPLGVLTGGHGCRHIVVGYSAGVETTLRIPAAIASEHHLRFLNLAAHPPARLGAATTAALTAATDLAGSIPVARHLRLDDPGALVAEDGGVGRTVLSP